MNVSARRLLGWVTVVSMQLLSCGGTDVPVCPTGSCELAGSTVVKWSFNHYPEWKFESDACSDVGAFNVHVDVTNVDDPSIIESMEKGCSEGQLTFLDLPPGMYSVAVTPLDPDGAPLVGAAIAGQVLAGTSGENTEVTVNVPYTAWSRTYTGQFLFRLSWAGMSCAAALPVPVVKQTLRLTAGGAIVAATNDMGQRMDGTDPRPCRPLTEPFAQFVQGLPFGPATLLVTGTDSADVVRFQHQFDTFVGAGTFNPTFTFDVPVDAPPDTM